MALGLGSGLGLACKISRGEIGWLAVGERVRVRVWGRLWVRARVRVRVQGRVRVRVMNRARRRGARPEEGVRATAAVEEVAWRQAAQPADAAQLVVLRLARQQRAA